MTKATTASRLFIEPPSSDYYNRGTMAAFSPSSKKFHRLVPKRYTPSLLGLPEVFRHPAASQSIPAFGDEDSFCGMCGQRYGSTRTAELLLYSSTLQVRADYGRFPSKCFPSASCCLTLSRRTPYHG